MGVAQGLCGCVRPEDVQSQGEESSQEGVQVQGADSEGGLEFVTSSMRQRGNMELYWIIPTIVTKQVELISCLFTTSPGGWVDRRPVARLEE